MPLALDDFDLILGMDWLRHRAQVNCFTKNVNLQDVSGKGSIQGRKEGESNLLNLGHDGQKID